MSRFSLTGNTVLYKISEQNQYLSEGEDGRNFSTMMMQSLMWKNKEEKNKYIKEFATNDHEYNLKKCKIFSCDITEIHQ